MRFLLHFRANLKALYFLKIPPTFLVIPSWCPLLTSLLISLLMSRDEGTWKLDISPGVSCVFYLELPFSNTAQYHVLNNILILMSPKIYMSIWTSLCNLHIYISTCLFNISTLMSSVCVSMDILNSLYPKPNSQASPKPATLAALYAI